MLCFLQKPVQYSYVNPGFVEQVLRFCRANLADLRQEQLRIEPKGMHYPLMKLVDMYFWQIGFEPSTEP